MRKSGSFVDLLIGCIKISVTDIVADGSGKQVGILQDNTEGAAQIIFFDLGDIDAVIADFSLLNIVETVEEVLSTIEEEYNKHPEFDKVNLIENSLYGHGHQCAV